MSAGTRIVFLRFLTTHSSKLVPWQEHTRCVAGVTFALADESDETLAIVWKLASANNRTLARSAIVFSGFEAAHDDATELVARADELDSQLVSNELSGGFGWYLESASAPSVVCARWYSTARDRNHSMQIARASLGSSVVEAGPRQLGR